MSDTDQLLHTVEQAVALGRAGFPLAPLLDAVPTEQARHARAFYNLGRAEAGQPPIAGETTL